MTAQIHDSIILHDKRLSIVRVNGNELFNPVDFDVHPFPGMTGYWRGYICTYRTRYNKLLLDKLEVNLHEQGPEINGVQPLFSKAMFNNVYIDLNMPADFTGEIRAADQFIRELYVHMGFHPAWKYETVYELVILHGYILDTKDVSKQMSQIREQMTRERLDPPRNRDWEAK